ncbi:hypothetical protein V6N11_075459 [Hibiscus sabdariffa]|uniref:OTU1-like C-terminal C2H2-type zinc finger domain-containing protein n=1 Tax=Hibiscus sabdariffa TaxID=183260 RepID=A0ABR2R6X8_9ROSI
MNPNCWDEQRSNIENQLNRLESLFEENSRYLLMIQNLLWENGIILKPGDCGTLLESVEEAQEHAELTFHSNFSQSTKVVLNPVCTSGDIAGDEEDMDDPEKDRVADLADFAEREQ